MLLNQILGITKTYKSKNKSKSQNVKLNSTLHIKLIKVNKTIDICIIIL